MARMRSGKWRYTLDKRQTRTRGPHTTPGALKSLDTTTFSTLLFTSCRILGQHTQLPPEPMDAQPWEEDQTRPAADQTPASLAGHWRTRENLLISQGPNSICLGYVLLC